jgi:hypothetical protein
MCETEHQIRARNFKQIHTIITQTIKQLQTRHGMVPGLVSVPDFETPDTRGTASGARSILRSLYIRLISFVLNTPDAAHRCCVGSGAQPPRAMAGPRIQMDWLFTSLCLASQYCLVCASMQVFPVALFSSMYASILSINSRK